MTKRKDPKDYKKRGRPTVMTPEAILKLEQAFANGANDQQAVFYAGIAPATFYNWCEKNPDFLERKKALKENLKFIAKNVVAQALRDGNIQEAKWFLERLDKDFIPKKHIESQDLDADGNPTDKKIILSIEDKAILERIGINPEEAF